MSLGRPSSRQGPEGARCRCGHHGHACRAEDARRHAPPTPIARASPSTRVGPDVAGDHRRRPRARRAARGPTVGASDAVITDARVVPQAARRRAWPTPITRGSQSTVMAPIGADDHRRLQLARRATRCPTVRAAGAVITSAPFEPQSARRRAPPTPTAWVCPYTGTGSDGADNR